MWQDDDYYDDADAYYYDDDDEYDDLSDQFIAAGASGDWDEFSAYISDEWNKKWTVEDPVEQAELECVACMYDVLGRDCLQGPCTCASFSQEGCTAFLAKGKGKGKGKSR